MMADEPRAEARSPATAPASEAPASSYGEDGSKRAEARTSAVPTAPLVFVASSAHSLRDALIPWLDDFGVSARAEEILSETREALAQCARGRLEPALATVGRGTCTIFSDRARRLISWDSPVLRAYALSVASLEAQIMVHTRRAEGQGVLLWGEPTTAETPGDASILRVRTEPPPRPDGDAQGWCYGIDHATTYFTINDGPRLSFDETIAFILAEARKQR